jgi:hypothetical protein
VDDRGHRREHKAIARRRLAVRIERIRCVDQHVLADIREKSIANHRAQSFDMLMRQLMDTLSNPIATPGFTGPDKLVCRIGERDGMDCRSDGEQWRV